MLKQYSQNLGLCNANFSNADIRGKKFKKLILESANFSNTKAGLTRHARILLLICCCLAQVIAGVVAAQGGELTFSAWRFQSQLTTKLISTPLFIVLLLVYLIVTTQFGFTKGLLAGMGAAVVSLVLALILTKNFYLITYIFFFGIGSLALVSIGLFVSTVSTIIFIIACKNRLITISINLILFLVGSTTTLKAESSLVAVITAALGSYIACKALVGNQIFKWILDSAVSVMAIGGTSFRGANLTNVDFTNASLRNSDFRNAVLEGVYWFNVTGLDHACFGGGYIQYRQVRQLVVTLNGQAQNFDGLNLEGVNLQGAKLQDASFIGANLNHANLRNANLSRAILKQAQLDGVDLTGAILTGACIEDWGITGTTQLEGVQCDYVFMRLETKDNPNRLRKPDNWGENFADGDFCDFIKPYVDTLDLYHSQDIDPRAISIALKNLSANHPGEKLMLVAIERRGGNGLNLRFTTAPGADKSELSHEYFTDYARIKKELPIAVQLRLAEQDAEIRTLKGTIEQFIEAGTHQSKIQAETIQVIQGELVVTQNKGINISSSGGSIGDISGLVGGDVSGVVNLGTISGNVTNTINQLPDASEPDQPNLKELLTQLQQAIENDSDLSDPDKADLLEQVQVLAEAKQIEEPAKKEGLARKARKMFDATLSSLPQTASIVEACSKLLPMVLKALGLSA